MSPTSVETLLSIYILSSYFFMVLLTTYLGRKSNLHWGYVAGISLLLSPIAGMTLILWFGERMNSYHRVERLKQLLEQGILNEEEFNWKYKPVSKDIMLRELGILRDEGVLTRAEYRSKVYRIIERGTLNQSQDKPMNSSNHDTRLAV